MLTDDQAVVSIFDEENPVIPWVFFRLYEDDSGSIADRTVRQEYIDRSPFCLLKLTPDEVWVEVVNLGTVMSDLVIVEYQVIYCTFEGHGPADGFSQNHAGEYASDEVSTVITAASIPAGESHLFKIDLPDKPTYSLKNLYFRARVSTLWGEKPPMELWRFEDEPWVTEGHVRF